MGSASSSQGRGDDEDDDDDDDDEEAEETTRTRRRRRGRGDDEDEDEDEDEDDDDEEAPNSNHHNESKVLEQEPEILPCHAPATPISAASTPRVLGPSIRVWDPCNVLLPPSPPLPSGFGAADAGSGAVEVFLISHGECGAGLRPDLVGGRWSTAGLTGNGERQARALAVFLNSQGVRFGAVYCSPLDRARATATFVCRELEFAEEQIKSSDSLIEMSQGQWEGCHRSEIYTPEIINLIDRTQPDFSAPSGESLRQVQFRMIEFLNRAVLRLSEKLTVGETSMHRNEAKGFTRHNSNNSVQDRDGPQWELLYKHRQGLQRKKSGKSRLQTVTTTLDNGTEDDFSQNEASHEHLLHPATAIGIFTHLTPIKCLLTGLLDCSPSMSQKICIDDSSVTVLQHSLQTGWQIKRMNDTSHLRLL